MELNLTRIDHPSRLARLCGVSPGGSYLEHCWGPLVGPSVMALVRRTHELTSRAGGPARIDCRDMAQLLGMKASEAPERNNPIGKALRRAHTFRLGVADLSAGTFALHNTVHLLTPQQYRRLPTWSQERHLAEVDEVISRLRAAGVDSSVLAGATQLRAGPVPDQRERDSARAAAHRSGPVAPQPGVGASAERPLPERALTARLAQLSAPATTEPHRPSASL